MSPTEAVTVARESAPMTVQALQTAELSVLSHLEQERPVSVADLLDQLEEALSSTDLRRALWSLIAKGKLRVTPEFKLVKV